MGLMLLVLSMLAMRPVVLFMHNLTEDNRTADQLESVMLYPFISFVCFIVGVLLVALCRKHGASGVALKNQESGR